MHLNEFSARKRTQILEALREGAPPGEGAFSETLLAEARLRTDSPQMGSLRYLPNEMVLEFIYPADGAAALVFPVTLKAPERIVYLPVPKWVVQSVWQGEVLGSYHFESDALRLIQEFEAGTASAENAAHFGEDASTGGRGA